MKPPALTKTQQRPAARVEGLERGDHVYARTDRGPIAVRVLAHGRDGFTGECAEKKRHQIPWDRYLGHRSRMLQEYQVVDQGADGAILEDNKGRRRYLAGEVPTPSAAPPADEDKNADDPLIGGLKRMKKALPMLPHDAMIIMLKAAPRAAVANRPGLQLEAKTDREGHQTHRWVRTVKDQPAAKDAKGAPGEADQPPMKHGDLVQFRHGDVGGEGKIIASGKDGVTLQGPDGQTHQVRHEHLEGPANQPRPGDVTKTPEQPGAIGAHGAKILADFEKQRGGAQQEQQTAPAKNGFEFDPAPDRLGQADERDRQKGTGAADAPLFSPAETSDLPAKANQPTSDKAELYKESAQALDYLKSWLNEGKGLCSQMGYETMKGGMDGVDWEKPGGMLFIAPLKGEKRAAEKVEQDYGGDWSQLRDVVRCSIAVDTMQDLQKTLGTLKQNGLELAMKPKDRFAKPLPVGYRDLLMNVKFPNGTIGEVQLHIKGMLRAKEDGHHYYEIERSLVGKGEDKLTDEEKDQIKAAQAKQVEIYGDAWRAISGGQANNNGGGEPMKKSLATEAFDYLDHDGATFRRRRSNVSWAVDDVFADGKWSPYKGDRLKAGMYGDRVDNPEGQMAKSESLVLFKAQIPHAGTADLLQTVNVPGHTRGGKYVAPYTARRHKHPVAAPAKRTIDEKLERLNERRDPDGIEPSPDIKHFYVSAIDGSKRYLVAGPYESHEEAKGMVEHVRKHADRDPRAHFMAWGTAGTAEPTKTPLGKWKPEV